MVKGGMGVETRHVPGGEDVNPGEGMGVGHLGPQLAVFNRKLGDLQGGGPVVLQNAIGGGDEPEATVTGGDADLHGLARVFEEKLVISG